MMFDTPIDKFSVIEHSDGEGTVEELDSGTTLWIDIIHDQQNVTVLCHRDETVSVGDLLVLPAQ